MNKDRFSSKLGMILAAAAGSVGLGNVWKFPYMLGENGGAAFLLVYILCVILFGLPLMMAEFLIGKEGKGSVYSVYRHLSGTNHWNWLPWLTVTSTTLITGVYLIIIGWCLGYLYLSITGAVTQVVDINSAGQIFHSFSGNSVQVVLFTTISILLSIAMLWAGVNKGVERLSKILMPLLLLLLVILVVRVMFLDDASKGYAFLFQPNWTCLTPRVVLEAMGQCFYSLSIGMGALITYGAYMPKEQGVAKGSIQIVVLDTLAALLAGCAIFPAVFAFGFSPEQGPKLVFEMVPLVFGQMAGGRWFTLVFFALLAIAAITSVAFLMEMMVAALVEATANKRHPLTRHHALILAGAACLVVSVVCVLSSEVFSWVDFITSTVTLPLIALCTVIFFGWFVADKLMLNKLSSTNSNKGWVVVFRFLIRWFIPVIIMLILLNGLGAF